jgi:hypothetical protein
MSVATTADFQTRLGDCPRTRLFRARLKLRIALARETGVASRHAASASLRPSRIRHLPRDCPRGRRRIDLSRRRRSLAVCIAPASRGEEMALAPARLMPDDHPFSPDRARRAREPLAGDAPAQLPLRAGLQRAVRPARPPVPGPLPCTRHPGRRASDERLRIRARQRRPRRALRDPRRLALARGRVARRPTRKRARARGQAPTSTAGTTPRRARSGGGSRARARPASFCGFASCPRR